MPKGDMTGPPTGATGPRSGIGRGKGNYAKAGAVGAGTQTGGRRLLKKKKRKGLLSYKKS